MAYRKKYRRTKGESVMEAIKKFAVACIDKLKANPTLMYVVIGLAAFIVFVLVIIIALSIKRAKTKKRLAIEAKEAEAAKMTERRKESL
jgi:uncharacterized membrane protein